jgi:predicted membrane-bound dolichyl-phosphate-mannose-protein mannosyltransferase
METLFRPCAGTRIKTLCKVTFNHNVNYEETTKPKCVYYPIPLEDYEVHAEGSSNETNLVFR